MEVEGEANFSIKEMLQLINLIKKEINPKKQYELVEMFRNQYNNFYLFYKIDERYKNKKI